MVPLLLRVSVEPEDVPMSITHEVGVVQGETPPQALTVTPLLMVMVAPTVSARPSLAVAVPVPPATSMPKHWPATVAQVAMVPALIAALVVTTTRPAPAVLARSPPVAPVRTPGLTMLMLPLVEVAL